MSHLPRPVEQVVLGLAEGQRLAAGGGFQLGGGQGARGGHLPDHRWRGAARRRPGEHDRPRVEDLAEVAPGQPERPAQNLPLARTRTAPGTPRVPGAVCVPLET